MTILYVVMHEEIPWTGSTGQVRAFTDLSTARKSLTQARKTNPECRLAEFSDLRHPTLAEEDVAQIRDLARVDGAYDMAGER